MGGNLLRRKILKNIINNSACLVKALLPVILFVCFAYGNLLFASESSEPEPVNSEFNRPLRTVKVPADPRDSADSIESAVPAEIAVPIAHPKDRGMLPASYQTGREVKPGNLLANPEYLEQALTQHYIRQYSVPAGLSWLFAVMDRAGPYLAFIRKEIAERDLPEELIYLPVIESGYLPTALSRSGALGLWQFMKNSIAPFDIRVNDWVDERQDFWKSTQGALRKLEDNYRQLGDWPLALAAYNAGLGGVSRAVQQSGINDYWTLSERKILKTETIHYVPKLLAAAYVLSDPRRYGMEPRWPEDPQWKRVAVDRSADLYILAAEAGIDSGELIRANRELLHNVTPPGHNYFLKVPGKDAEKVEAVLARKDLQLVRYYFHTIRSGDTLLALGLHYGISVDQILASNPGVQARYLGIGSRLLIPALKETGPYERSRAPGENLLFNGNHLVKRGETLWSIALAYEVDPEVLAEANGMKLTDVLREGRVLKTPIR